MQNQPTEVSTNELHRAKQSVAGRLKRLKTVSNRWHSKESPIAEIGCFDEEIDKMEELLQNMDSRLNRAKVIIPAE